MNPFSFLNARCLTVLAVLLLSTNLAGAQPKPARRYAGGLVFTRTRALTVLNKAPLTEASYANLPARVSYEAYCPSVGDQGKAETSVAFATAYYLRTIMDGRAQNLTQKPQLDNARFSPTFVYARIRDPKDVTCQGGGTLEEALAVLKTDGVPRLSTLAYPQCNAQLPATVVQEANRFRIGDYQQLFTETAPADQKVRSVKKALTDGNPVVIGIGAPLSFEEVKNVWQPAPNEKPADAVYNQALCVIGYDDARQGGAFRVVNSWGRNWGEGGLCWIPYVHFGTFALNAFQVYAPPTDTFAPVVASTGNPPAQPETTGRRGSAELKLGDGSPMPLTRAADRDLTVAADATAPADIQPYRSVQPYPSGTRFKFYLTNSENAYIYALTLDRRGTFQKLVPYDELTSPLLGPNTIIAYPATDQSIVMDNHRGTDYLLLLFARRPLNTNGLLKALDRRRGPLASRVADVLADQLVRPDQIRYRPDAVDFTVAPNATGNVVPVLIELAHQ